MRNIVPPVQRWLEQGLVRYKTVQGWRVHCRGRAIVLVTQVVVCLPPRWAMLARSYRRICGCDT